MSFKTNERRFVEANITLQNSKRDFQTKVTEQYGNITATGIQKKLEGVLIERKDMESKSAQLGSELMSLFKARSGLTGREDAEVFIA
jgi:hypothetical protein